MAKKLNLNNLQDLSFAIIFASLITIIYNTIILKSFKLIFLTNFIEYLFVFLIILGFMTIFKINKKIDLSISIILFSLNVGLIFGVFSIIQSNFMHLMTIFFTRSLFTFIALILIIIIDEVFQ